MLEKTARPVAMARASRAPARATMAASRSTSSPGPIDCRSRSRSSFDSST